MKKRNSSGKYIAGLILLIALCVFGAFITTKGITKKKIGRASNIELGLDLAGGVSITYEVDGKNVSDSDMKDTVYKLPGCASRIFLKLFFTFFRGKIGRAHV